MEFFSQFKSQFIQTSVVRMSKRFKGKINVFLLEKFENSQENFAHLAIMKKVYAFSRLRSTNSVSLWQFFYEIDRLLFVPCSAVVNKCIYKPVNWQGQFEPNSWNSECTPHKHRAGHLEGKLTKCLHELLKNSNGTLPRNCKSSRRHYYAVLDKITKKSGISAS